MVGSVVAVAAAGILVLVAVVYFAVLLVAVSGVGMAVVGIELIAVVVQETLRPVDVCVSLLVHFQEAHIYSGSVPPRLCGSQG